MYSKNKHSHSAMVTVISLVTLVLSTVALLATVSVLCERKKKDEEELERYLDGSIQ